MFIDLVLGDVLFAPANRAICNDLFAPRLTQTKILQKIFDRKLHAVYTFPQICEKWWKW
jgi:hypothetical protein